MSLFVLSDTHLSLGADKPMDVFGRRWEGYVSKIEQNWRKVVSEKDTVVISGDVSWGMTLEQALPDLLFLDSLPGRKIIGRGNHDYWWTTLSKMRDFFSANGLSTLFPLYNNAYYEQGFLICGSRGWFIDEKGAPPGVDYAKIVSRETIRLGLSFDAAEKLAPAGSDPEKLVFLHFPPLFGDFECPEILALLSEKRVSRCFFGHIHGAYDLPPSFSRDGTSFILTSADYLDFLPMRID